MTISEIFFIILSVGEELCLLSTACKKRMNFYSNRLIKNYYNTGED